MAVGFVGLGTMGGPMAGHLLSNGNETWVWNRTPDKAASLVDAGARLANSLGILASHCEKIAVCVNRTEDVEEVVALLTAGAKPGTLIVDHSTIEPLAAANLSNRLSKQGIRFVDAPVTGGSMGAQKGQLTIFLGGEEPDCLDATEFIKPYTKVAERVGGPGAGQQAKMANQIAVAGALLGLCESMAFAKKADLDLAQIKRLVGGGAAGSWCFENYGPKILAGDWSPGFSVKNQRKDFAYCLAAAKAIDACLPATALADRLLAHLQEEGRGEEATAALFEVFSRLGADC